MPYRIFQEEDYLQRVYKISFHNNEMLDKVFKYLESKRESKRLFWKKIVKLKDIIWSKWIFSYKILIKELFSFDFWRDEMSYPKLICSKKQLDFPIYCINLKKRKDRKKSVLIEYGKIGMSPLFFGAIDGTILNKKILLKKNILSNDLRKTNGAIGCYLSHYELWKKIVEKRIPFALITEDDIIFKCKKEELFDYLKAIPRDFKVCFGGPGLNRISILNKKISSFSKRRIYGAYFYFISYEGAKELMQSAFPMEMAVDIYMGKKNYKNAKTLCFTKNLVYQRTQVGEKGFYSDTKEKSWD